MTDTPDPQNVSRAVRDAAAAFAPLHRAIQQVVQTSAFQELARFAQSPEGQQLLAEAEARREIEPTLPCHCLCQHQHGDRMGICDGEGVGTRRFGHVDVPLCGPCMSITVTTTPQED